MNYQMNSKTRNGAEELGRQAGREGGIGIVSCVKACLKNCTGGKVGSYRLMMSSSYQEAEVGRGRELRSSGAAQQHCKSLKIVRCVNITAFFVF